MLWLVTCLAFVGAGVALVWAGWEIRKENPDA